MPRTTKAVPDVTILQAALEGLEAQKQRIEEQIAQIRSLLGRRGPGRAAATVTLTGTQPVAKKRQLSEAARKRIAAAQKRRWAEYRKRMAQQAKEAAKEQES